MIALQVIAADTLTIVTIGVVLGYIAGRVVGHQDSIAFRERILLGSAIVTIGGLMFPIALMLVFSLEPAYGLMAAGSLAFGFLLGAAMYWSPSRSQPKSRIVYEPDDDDDFDREIDEALHGADRRKR
jgi:hypothetical protein